MRTPALLVIAISTTLMACGGGSGSSTSDGGGGGGRAGTGGRGGRAGGGGHAGGLGGGTAGGTAVAGNGGSNPDGGGDAGSGGGNPDGGGQTTASVGGTVSGLVGTGLVLTDGLGHQLVITADGTFQFASRVSIGSDVAVTVALQPMSPTQTCTVTGGTITAIAQDASTVVVACATNRYQVGGTLSGLTGSGLVLQNNGGDDLTVTADGSFTFATTVASGATFTVSVKTQPSGPAQTCQLSGASGTVGASDVTGVVVNCAINSYTVGGTVTGLSGSGLVLQNGAAELPVTGNGSFSFPTPIASGGAFAITIKTQPSSPVQTCSVGQGTGTVASGNVTSVTVTCATQAYAVGGSVAGLAGAGLVLQNNRGDNLSVNANNTFTFASQVASGATYNVTVLTQPSSPAQTCTVARGSGIVADAAVDNVGVTCTTNYYTVGGTVVGLAGTGLVLRNQGGNDRAITGNGPFTFTASALSGTPFAVTIATQPTNPSQTCTVSGATGTVGGAPVSSVIVNCSTDQHVVGGTVTGLTGGGLKLSLNNGATVAVGENGSFAFSATQPSGGSYAVTVGEQPTAPWQTCTVTNGTGTIGATDVASVAVACTTNSYKVGGTATGLVGAGLVLRNNGGDDLPVSTDGTFVFPSKVASGSGYAVTVAAQPHDPSQTCAIGSGSGGITGADITNVTVTCSVNHYPVGGTITGLAGTVVLQNNAGDNLVLTANGSFAFPTQLSSGAHYAVTVSTQPTNPFQTCAVLAGTGAVSNAAIGDIVVTCLTNRYTVGGAIVGLTGSNLVLQNSGGDDLVLGPTDSFTFPTSVESGSDFAVTIKTQPSGPTQTCSVGGATGKIGNANVTTVTINCSTNSYLIGGTVTGLSGSGLVLQNDGGQEIPLPGSGTFSFSAPASSGTTYAVTVKTQPTNPWQTCTPSANASGTVTNANVSVAITCVSTPFPIRVSVTNLAGSGLVLQNNAGDNLAIPSSGTYTFANPIRSGLTYSITVLSQPTILSQKCTVTAPTDFVAGDPVTVAVNCVTETFNVNGTVTGLKGTGLVIRNNGADDLGISADGNFTFPTPVASGASYAVTVAAQPTQPLQNCQVTGGSGAVTSSPITGVSISCTNVVTCATADEYTSLTLACPAGHQIRSIDFASYGHPNGVCGGYSINSDCDAPTSFSFMTAACVGQESCTVDASNSNFGDPCKGYIKWLFVQASCS